MRFALASAALAAISAVSTPSGAQQPAPRLTAGSIQDVTATTLTVMSKGQAVRFRLTPRTEVILAHPGGIGDIKPGSFIGTTNVTGPGGVRRSTEVHVFPPGVKLGEGDRPMASARSGSTASRMTNGVVAQAQGPGGSRMTNGSVAAAAASAGGLALKVDYAGGARRIVVPPNTPVMVMTSGRVGDLHPGENVLVGAAPAPGGEKVAAFINIQPQHP